MMTRTLLLIAGFGLFSACTDHTEGTTAAEVQDVAEPAAEPVAEPAPAAAPAALAPLTAPEGGAIVKGNGENSKIEWVGAKITKSHPGGFNDFTVEAAVKDQSLTAIQGTIQIGSMFSDSEKLTGHLLDSDFFNASRFGTATFSSTQISPNEGGGHTITGVLDMHGVKKQVSFPATISVTEGSATVDAEFNLNRKDWGINYAGKPDDLIKDAVVVKLDFNLS